MHIFCVFFFLFYFCVHSLQKYIAMHFLLCIFVHMKPTSFHIVHTLEATPMFMI